MRDFFIEPVKEEYLVLDVDQAEVVWVLVRQTSKERFRDK